MRSGKSSAVGSQGGRERMWGDLNLRLGLMRENEMAPDNNTNNTSLTIVLDDDDDDGGSDNVQVTSPRSMAKAILSASTRHRRVFHIPVLDDEDLELRLGPTGSTLPIPMEKILPSGRINQGGLQETNLGLSLSIAIDLTSSTDHRIAGESNQMQEKSLETSKEVKLTCTICLDAMKEETSTICGHIFCKGCITNALKGQKKCPTCRRKLTNKQVHRIFLSGSTRICIPSERGSTGNIHHLVKIWHWHWLHYTQPMLMLLVKRDLALAMASVYGNILWNLRLY